MPVTPIRLVPKQYRTKTIIDPSGNVRNWEDVDPNYEIYTDENGRPVASPSNNDVLEFGTSGTPMYAGPDLAEASDTETIRLKQADNYVNEGWGGRQWGKVAGIMGASALAAGAGAWALGNPVIQGALNLFGAYEGGKDLIKNNRFGLAWNNVALGRYYSALKDAGIGTLDVLGISMPALTTAIKASPYITIYKAANNVKVTNPNITPQMRFRVGDVEVNDPNLAYRQQNDILDDFFSKGYVRSLSDERSLMVGRFDLQKSFPRPMFSLGRLWYDNTDVMSGQAPRMKDLLVTREPLLFANLNARPIKYDFGGRRIPRFERQLTPTNTSAYRWEDGYGFRRVTPEMSKLRYPFSEGSSKNYSTYDDYDFELYAKNLSITPTRINNEALRYYDRVVQPLLKTDRPLFNDYNLRAIVLDEVPDEPSFVGGIHYPDTGENIVARKGDMISTGIHEITSHGTDDIVSDEFLLEYEELVKGLLDKYLGPVGRGAETVAEAREFRATMNQIRKLLLKYWLKKGKVDLTGIDKVSDEELMKLMRNSNGYGEVYQRAYKLLPESLQSEWMLRFRNALKTLPIAGGVLIGSQNDEKD